MSEYIYCPRHPSEPVSNGLFDAPCGACEYEMAEAAEEWEYDPANPKRTQCHMTPYIPNEPHWWQARTCLYLGPAPHEEDDIPF